MSAKSVVFTMNLVKLTPQSALFRRCIHHSSNNNFEFPSFTEVRKRREFQEKNLAGYSMQQMYDVVSDVENYHKFVPFCKKSIVYKRTKGSLKADLEIGFPPLTERYTSNVTFSNPTEVKAECVDGKMFNYLLTHWRFSPGLKDIPKSCVIDFDVAFEFKSVLHSQLANFFFDQLVKQMETAFIYEARARYGQPSIKSIQINLGNSRKLS